jgi:hypothetical protein
VSRSRRKSLQPFGSARNHRPDCAHLASTSVASLVGSLGVNVSLESNLRTVESAFAALLPGMVARRKGSLLLVALRNVERPWAGKGSAAYTASKATVLGLGSV